MNSEEIEDECLDNNHAVRITVIEGRAYPVLCSECKKLIKELG